MEKIQDVTVHVNGKKTVDMNLRDFLDLSDSDSATISLFEDGELVGDMYTDRQDRQQDGEQEEPERPAQQVEARHDGAAVVTVRHDGAAV